MARRSKSDTRERMARRSKSDTRGRMARRSTSDTRGGWLEGVRVIRGEDG